MRKFILSLSLLTIAAFAATSQILPDWTWAKAIGGTQGVQLQNVLMDNVGNMYISGSAYSPLHIDGAVFSTDTNLNIFVAKFNSAGSLLWNASVMKKDPKPQGTLYAESIMLDKWNNLYFTIGSSGAYSVDSLHIVINTSQQKEIVIVVNGYYEQPSAVLKFDPNGNLKYSAEILGYGNWGGKKKGQNKGNIKGGSQNLTINGSVVDDQGNLYLAGSFMLDSFKLGNLFIKNSQTNKNSFIAKVDTGGNFLWTTIDSTSVPILHNGSEAISVSLDASGDPIVIGDFASSDRKFGNFSLNLGGTLNNNLYFVTLNRTDGSPKALLGSGGGSNDFATSITSDSYGNFYATGFTSSTQLFGQPASPTNYFESFLLKIDSSLNVIWTKVLKTEIQVHSPNDILPVTYGPDKFPVLTGYFVAKTLSVDAFNVSNHDTISGTITNDYFIARFDPNGNATYLKSFGTRYDDLVFNPNPNFNVYSDIHNMVTCIAPLMDTAFYIGNDTVKYPAGSIGFMIAHYDTAGLLLGQKIFLADPVVPFSVLCSNIVQSYSGYLGVAGTFSSPAISIGNNLLTAQDTLNFYDIFISKMAYTMSGTIFDQANLPVAIGYVKLYVLTPFGPANLIDSAQLTGTGNYKFTDAPLNGSMLYAVADTNKYPDYVGTYSGNSLLWTGAAILDLVSSPPSVFNVTVKQMLPITGPGNITGTVTDILPVVKPFGLKSFGRPMKGASVVLIGKSTKGADTIIAVTLTDDAGFYHFTKVPVGDYKIWIDVAGLGMLEYYAVTISDVAPTIENADYYVGESGIYKDLSSAIKIVKQVNPSVLIYPNPATDFIHAIIPLNGAPSARIDIYNGNGQLVSSLNLESSTAGNVIINTSGLPSGIYILKADIVDKSPAYGRFIKQ
jgi:hypothetical protein